MANKEAKVLCEPLAIRCSTTNYAVKLILFCLPNECCCTENSRILVL